MLQLMHTFGQRDPNKQYRPSKNCIWDNAFWKLQNDRVETLLSKVPKANICIWQSLSDHLKP